MLMFTVYDKFLDLNLEGFFETEQECREFYADILDDFPQFIHIVNSRPATAEEMKTAETRAELLKELEECEEARFNFRQLVYEYGLHAEFPEETRMQLDRLKDKIDGINYKLSQLK